MKELALIIAQLIKMIFDELKRYQRKKEIQDVKKEADDIRSDPAAALKLRFGRKKDQSKHADKTGT